jgi:Mycolic acid cyclopropane synthetase
MAGCSRGTKEFRTLSGLHRKFLPRRFAAGGSLGARTINGGRGKELAQKVRAKQGRIAIPLHLGVGIRFHYDRSNDFYRQFLESRLVYSSAYFRDFADALDPAQLAKLDLICRKHAAPMRRDRV